MLSWEEKRQFSYHLFKAWLEARRFLGIQNTPHLQVDVSQYDNYGGNAGMLALVRSDEKNKHSSNWKMAMPTTMLYENIVQLIRRSQNQRLFQESQTTEVMVHEVTHLLSNGKYFGFVKESADYAALSDIRSYATGILFGVSSTSNGIHSLLQKKMEDMHFMSRIAAWNNMSNFSDEQKALMTIYCGCLNIAARLAKVCPSFGKKIEAGKTSGAWVSDFFLLEKNKSHPDAQCLISHAQSWAQEIARMPLSRVHAETNRNIKHVWGNLLIGKLAKPLTRITSAKNIRIANVFDSSKSARSR